jgi:thioredoxin reductase (NADPH)
MANVETDVVIIGAGPAGLFAAFQCGMVKLHSHVVDVLDTVGGQCQALYPEKMIYDIPAYPGLTAQHLVEQLKAQAQQVSPTYHLSTQVVSLDRTADHRWQAGLSDGTVIKAPVVIIAAGCGAFGPNRPPLAQIEEYEGKSVHYFVARREQYRDKRVVIAGGGDSAVDWALNLVEIAARVMVVHRRAKFRASPASEAQLLALAEAGKLDLIVPYQLHGLIGQSGQLTGVEIATLAGECRTLPADNLLAFFGMAMDIGPIAHWRLNMTGAHIAVNPTTMQTNLEGVYAIGDICTYPGKLKLILTGFAEAALAAHNAFAQAHPGQALHVEHSSTSGVPV